MRASRCTAATTRGSRAQGALEVPRTASALGAPYATSSARPAAEVFQPRPSRRHPGRNPPRNHSRLAATEARSRVHRRADRVAAAAGFVESEMPVVTQAEATRPSRRGGDAPFVFADLREGGRPSGCRIVPVPRNPPGIHHLLAQLVGQFPALRLARRRTLEGEDLRPPSPEPSLGHQAVTFQGRVARRDDHRGASGGSHRRAVRGRAIASSGTRCNR